MSWDGQHFTRKILSQRGAASAGPYTWPLECPLTSHRSGGILTTLTLRGAALLVLAGLTLTACGGNTSSASSAAATPSAPAADGGTYADVNALQKAYISAGGNCAGGKYWGYVAFANGTIECDSDTMIDVFDDTAAILKYQAQDRAQGYGATMLQGSNWLIRTNTDELPGLKEKLGGKIVSYTSKG